LRVEYSTTRPRRPAFFILLITHRCQQSVIDILDQT